MQPKLRLAQLPFYDKMNTVMNLVTKLTPEKASMRMTREAILFCIKKKELCDSPELNRRLYLHNKGFNEIRNLEKYTEVRELFLELNKLERIEGLDALKHLQSLHLQENRIEIIENLDCCLELKYLNVSSNNISKIDDISILHALESLVLKENYLSKPDSIQNVIYMKSLLELDLSMNKINCNLEGILEVLSSCKSLKILSLKGNPVVTTKHYRKLVISKCLRLTRLDGNKICKEERCRCTAWGKVVDAGGSFDEADEVDRQELTNFRIRKSQENAIRRSLQRHSSQGADGSDDGGHSSKGSIGYTVMEGIKKAFGIMDSVKSLASSNIFSSRRDQDLLLEDEQRVKRLSLKEELKRVRRIVESQENEISYLRVQLEQVKGLEISIHAISSGGGTELDSSCSFTKIETMTQKMALEELIVEMQQLDNLPTSINPPSSTVAQKPNNRSTTGLQNFDPFSIFPPVPPVPTRRNTTL